MGAGRTDHRRNVGIPIDFDKRPCELSLHSPSRRSPRAGARTVLDDGGASTVAELVAVTIYRAVIETVGDDHRTLTWIVSPTVSDKMARVVLRLSWQPTQWDQR